MEQTILIGNGISRLLNSSKLEWKAVLSDTLRNKDMLLSVLDSSKKELVPYTHMYEDLFLNNKTKCPSTDNMQRHLNESIRNYLDKHTMEQGRDEYKKVIRKLTSLEARNILTTNYEYSLARQLEHMGYEKEKTKRLQRIYSTKRKHQYSKDDGQVLNLWYIHGELDYAESMKLGYDHYCGSITKISDYIKKGYLSDNDKEVLPNSLPGDKVTHHIIKKLHSSKEGDKTDLKTWMDTFFFSDVHIIGLGLEFQEIDLWWLLNKRYRYLKKCDTRHPLYNNVEIENKIYYYGYVSAETKAVLNAYGVDTTYTDEKAPENWSYYYCLRIENMKNNINKRKKHTL